jgi:hypothetical protein
MSIFERIAEQRIQEAMERGEFDNLPLKGAPLPMEDLSHVPEELRMGFKVLKNAGVLPEELELRREIVDLRRLLAACADEGERSVLRRRLTARQLRFDMLMEKNFRTPAWLQYEEKIDERMGF